MHQILTPGDYSQNSSRSQLRSGSGGSSDRSTSYAIKILPTSAFRMLHFSCLEQSASDAELMSNTDSFNRHLKTFLYLQASLLLRLTYT